MTTTNPAGGRSARGGALRFVSHTAVWVYGLLLAVPLYLLVVSALKDNNEIFGSPAGLPRDWRFHQFVEAFVMTDLGHALLNSAVITIGAEVVTLALALPAAYGLARSRGRLAFWVEGIFSAGFLIPAFATLVPSVLLSIAVGLFYNPLFLIFFLPATQLPLSVVLLTQFMRAIPREMEEAAMVDGASRRTVLWRIYTPMIGPGLVTVALLNFLTFWNEYLFALVILGTDAVRRTVQVAVPTLIGGQATDYGVLAAASVLSLVPVFAVYLLLQRRMEEALAAGALKG